MDLQAACKKLLIKEPFYGLFLLGLNKYYGNKCPTACVCRNGINTELCVNKEFWDKQDDETQLGILKHELGHIIFKHMFMWEFFGDKEKLNMATDCEVNSYIPVLQKDPYCYPAAFNLEDKKGSKYYYEHIPDQDGSSGGQGDGPDSNKIENHETWNQFKDLNDAEKELISQQIDHMAKQTAEQVSRMAGTIPGEFAGYIDSLFKQKPSVFNWKSYFRRLLGTAIETFCKKSRRKESKRFDGAAGIKQKHKHRILVAIDTSGSVRDTELCDFFSEINHIYKAGAQVDILEFDHRIQRVYEYKGKWDGSINGRGGTSFEEPIEWFNERRNIYSAFTLFTDGYASTEGLHPMKEMIWIITSDGNKSNRFPGKTVFIPSINE